EPCRTCTGKRGVTTPSSMRRVTEVAWLTIGYPLRARPSRIAWATDSNWLSRVNESRVTVPTVLAAQSRVASSPARIAAGSDMPIRGWTTSRPAACSARTYAPSPGSAGSGAGAAAASADGMDGLRERGVEIAAEDGGRAGLLVEDRVEARGQ